MSPRVEAHGLTYNMRATIVIQRRMVYAELCTGKSVDKLQRYVISNFKLISLLVFLVNLNVSMVFVRKFFIDLNLTVNGRPMFVRSFVAEIHRGNVQARISYSSPETLGHDKVRKTINLGEINFRGLK